MLAVLPRAPALAFVLGWCHSRNWCGAARTAGAIAVQRRWFSAPDER